MDSASAKPSETEASRTIEGLYYCDKHGVMNKPIALKDKADKIASSI